ncbi:MAG: metallophosphoesterase [Sphingomonadaceae bacterium]|nr:metallophosphoesterase [Sphingomonadaceae bacterium]MDW8413975.1 metallophosphoesterase [Thermaurantiacus sp.]
MAGASWGFLEARRDPVVVRHRAALAGLPPGPRLKVVLLSDPHAGSWDMPYRRLDRIVAQVNALEPDLVLLAGDYFAIHRIGQPPERDLVRALRPLAGLRARFGVWAVRGNHDNAWTHRIFAQQASPVLLVNRWVRAGPVVVAGIDSSSLSSDPARALAGVPADRPLIVLVHEPEQALALPPLERRAGTLVLAGHTHGGQVCLPLLGCPVTWREGPYPCRRGWCRLGGHAVLVTSGVGTSTVPLRIGVPPEVVELRLYPAGGRNSGTDRYRSPVS